MAQKKTYRLRRKQKKQLTILSAIVLAASFAAIMLLTPAFDIDKITVHGNSVVKAEDIIYSSGIAKGVNIFGINLGKVKKNITAMSYIDDATVKRRLPSEIDISVREAAGVAYINSGNGYLIITADGRALELVEKGSDNDEDYIDSAGKIGSIPVIKGLGKVKYKMGKEIKISDKGKYDSLTECLKIFASREYIFNMSEINIENLSDISFTYNGGGLKVLVGDNEKIDYKMDCFKSILAEIGSDAAGTLDLQRLTYSKK